MTLKVREGYISDDVIEVSVISDSGEVRHRYGPGIPHSVHDYDRTWVGQLADGRRVRCEIHCDNVYTFQGHATASVWIDDMGWTKVATRNGKQLRRDGALKPVPSDEVIEDMLKEVMMVTP